MNKFFIAESSSEDISVLNKTNFTSYMIRRDFGLDSAVLYKNFSEFLHDFMAQVLNLQIWSCQKF